MKIAISAMGDNLDSPVSEKFGRAPYFIIADSETLKFDIFENKAQSLQGGAGPNAVKQIAQHGAVVLLTGMVGQNAQNALEAAKITVITGVSSAMTVKEALGDYKEKALHRLA